MGSLLYYWNAVCYLKIDTCQSLLNGLNRIRNESELFCDFKHQKILERIPDFDRIFLVIFCVDRNAETEDFVYDARLFFRLFLDEIDRFSLMIPKLGDQLVAWKPFH